MNPIELRPGWQVKGTYNEACAAEGHCPLYFGRDVENGCRYYMVFRIEDGEVNGVSLGGITVIYNGDIHHSKFQEIMEHGSEGGVYISDNASEEQRHILDMLVTTSLGGQLMREIHAVKYVKIDVKEEDGGFQASMPFGEMKQHLVKGLDGGPVRIENVANPNLSNLKHCHTSFWTYKDHGKDFDYKNRCGTWADFAFQG